jgi:hypothetical protein
VSGSTGLPSLEDARPDEKDAREAKVELARLVVVLPLTRRRIGELM